MDLPGDQTRMALGEKFSITKLIIGKNENYLRNGRMAALYGVTKHQKNSILILYKLYLIKIHHKYQILRSESIVMGI